MDDKKLTDAILALTKQKPIFKTTIKNINKESGISVGSLYHNFKNKEDIINHSYLQFKQQMINNSDTSTYENFIRSFIKYNLDIRKNIIILCLQMLRNILLSKQK